jgi:hypothetical protein
MNQLERGNLKRVQLVEDIYSGKFILCNPSSHHNLHKGDLTSIISEIKTPPVKRELLIEFLK